MKSTKMIKAEEVKRDWILIDAKDKVFGRLITEIATKLKGKHKTYYTPHVDCGDFVIVINAKDVIFTGNKLQNKLYHTHSGYFGSTKSQKLEQMVDQTPEKLFKLATRGMLPKTKLGKAILKKLKVYDGSEHPHTAQIKGN
jgi:large subunit ribosomal protein L13